MEILFNSTFMCAFCISIFMAAAIRVGFLFRDLVKYE